MSNKKEIPTIRSRDSEGEPKTRVEVAYRRMRQEIVTGVIKPGTKLRAEDIRINYNIGASTMREVLSKLAADTLVTTIGQRGFYVSPISHEDFMAVADLRKLLEIKGLMDSIKLGGKDWEDNVGLAYGRLAELENRYDTIPDDMSDEWERRNRDFHRALVSACENPWLLHFRSILLDHSSRYIRLSLAKHPMPRDFQDEHRAIYRAAMARDADLAAKLLEEHIDATVMAIEKISD